MTLPKWTPDHDGRLTDLVFNTNLTHREMALQLNTSESFISSRIKQIGLGWVRRHKGNMSRGQGALTQLLRTILPGEKIVTEEPLGDRLFLDIYCPSYQIGIEYHGRQHFEYVEHFHTDAEGFVSSLARDERKQEICKNLGIALVVFRFNDKLDENTVIARLIDAIHNTPLPEKGAKKTLKGTEFYEQRKQRNNAYKREQYRKMRSTKPAD